MKLLLLTKRRFMSKDIIAERYGRQYELATRLAALGWDVQGYCLDYRSAWKTETVSLEGVEWYSQSAPLQCYSWIRRIRKQAGSWKPDIVFACSDPVHIVAGHRCARSIGAPLAIDLHDNLESFRLTNVPGLRASLVEAVRDADIVSCVSSPLQELVMEKYRPRGELFVLENAVSDDFTGTRPLKEDGRRQFGVDSGDQVLGIAGALYRKRGIETILAGFDLLRASVPRVRLALAGPTDSSRRGFARDGVRYFGSLRYSLMPSFLGMLDVGIVPNIRPVFADYCYPQKAVELCALYVPVVAADFGVMKSLAGEDPQMLYKADDPVDFARAAQYQLEHQVRLTAEVCSWARQAGRLDQLMREVL